MSARPDTPRSFVADAMFAAAIGAGLGVVLALWMLGRIGVPG